MDVVGCGKDQVMIHELREGIIYDYIVPPLDEVGDNGPYIAWQWAHNSFSAAHTYGQRELSQLRKSGYVIFDQVRLRNRYDLETPFQPVLGQSTTYYKDYTRARENMEYTFRKRSQIYDSGGRDDLNEDTGSRLIWQVSRPEDMAELTLGEPYRDFWVQGILVDRVRFDDYVVYDL